MAFHVPEAARLTRPGPLMSDHTYGNNGAFTLPSPEPGWALRLLASDEPLRGSIPWEHVSVSAYRGVRIRVPTWKEMSFVKDVFWDEDDVVMQLHPAKQDYVNHHPAVLHLWRPVGVAIPTPPSDMVAPKAASFPPGFSPVIIQP